MPDPTMSDAILEAYALAGEEPFFDTLEIVHEAIDPPIRVVNDRVPLSARLLVGGASVQFEAFAFRLSRPRVDSDGRPTCSVEVDGVTREVLGYLRQAAASAVQTRLVYRGYLADSPDPEVGPFEFVVVSARATTTTVTLEATTDDPAPNRPFPYVAYTLEQFPGNIG